MSSGVFIFKKLFCFLSADGGGLSGTWVLIKTIIWDTDSHQGTVQNSEGLSSSNFVTAISLLDSSCCCLWKQIFWFILRTAWGRVNMSGAIFSLRHCAILWTYSCHEVVQSSSVWQWYHLQLHVQLRSKLWEALSCVATQLPRNTGQEHSLSIAILSSNVVGWTETFLLEASVGGCKKQGC